MSASSQGASGKYARRPDGIPHHLRSREQQIEVARLGMWIFLATELLLFGGLFCFYAVYRAHHPDIFVYAHRFLDTTLGGINTVILIASSFTMAWAVRCAQIGARRGLVLLLAATLLLAGGFLGIKYVEYRSKWQEGLLWGGKFDAERVDAAAAHLDGAHADRPGAPAREGEKTGAAPARPANVHIFFGIYFLMTGLHGIHVIAGMGVMVWLVLRAIRGDFSPAYFLPVDLVGLYWHLVDIVWIFLFPLLYLIH